MPHQVLLSSRNLITLPSAATKVVINVQISLRSALPFIAAPTKVPRFCASSVSLGKSLHWPPPPGAAPGGAGNCAQALRLAEVKSAVAKETTKQQVEASDGARALFMS